MRLLLLAIALLGFTASAYADQYVRGYTRSNGTYVQPYMRSTPDSNPYNNYSTQGNVNPYTGAVGTHRPSSGYSGYGNSNNTFGSGNSGNTWGSSLSDDN